MTQLYQNIRTLCKERGIHISQLEFITGLPPNTIVNWKKDRRWMGYICNIARYFDVSVDSLLGVSVMPILSPSEKLINDIKSLDLDNHSLQILFDMALTLKKHKNE